MSKHLPRCPKRSEPKILVRRRVVAIGLEAKMRCGCKVKVWAGSIPNKPSAEVVHACENWKRHKYELADHEAKLREKAKAIIRAALH